MASSGGESAADLIGVLQSTPWQFSFFQALRLLDQSSPDAPRLGGLGPARAESVRLRPSSALRFQVADVSKLEAREGEGPPWRMTTTVLGLYGANSPLPSFYSEDILRAEMVEDDDPVRLFLDVVNHQLLSLLYAAWSKYRWEFSFAPGASDRTSRSLLGLLGMATPGLQEEIAIPAARLLRYAGTLSLRPRGAAAVAGVVSDFFDGVPAHVSQCLPRWVTVVPEDRNRLGSANCTLGSDLTVGERVYDRMGKCRVELGPLDLAGYETFLPEGAHAGALAELVALLLQDPLEWDLRLRLEGPEVPWLRLASDSGAVRLGWTSWLRSEPESPDKAEIFHAPLRARVQRQAA